MQDKTVQQPVHVPSCLTAHTFSLHPPLPVRPMQVDGNPPLSLLSINYPIFLYPILTAYNLKQ